MSETREPLRPEELILGDNLTITMEEIADRQAGRITEDDYPWAVMMDDCYTILRYGQRETVAHHRETLIMVGKAVILDPADDPETKPMDAA